MGIVEQAARIINNAAWMDGWVDQDGVRAIDHPLLRSRLAYQRAEAEVKATQILKLALSMPPDALREALVQAEIDGWKKLGMPMDAEGLSDMVREKYGDSGPARPSARSRSAAPQRARPRSAPRGAPWR